MTVCNGFNNENQRMRLISRWFRILPRLRPGFQTKRGIQRIPYISYFHDLWLPDSGPWPYHPNPYYTNALPDTPNLYKRTSATLKRNIFTTPFRGLVASNPANPLESAVRGCNSMRGKHNTLSLNPAWESRPHTGNIISVW